MLNSTLLKEAIADAKAVRQTELAWCKCVEYCMCDHCKPLKIKLAINQAKRQLKESFEARFEEMFAKKLEDEEYPMRNQTRTLSDKTLSKAIEETQRDVIL